MSRTEGGEGGAARLWVRLALRVLSLLALGFVFHAILGHWSDIAAWRPSAFGVMALVGLSLLYALALLSLGELWHGVLSAATGQQLPRRLTIGRHAVSQIAKYLPGNVWHMVGRHVGLAGGEISHGALMKAVTVEVTLLLAGAAIISAVGGVFLAAGTFEVAEVVISGHNLAIAAVACAVALCAAAFIVLGRRIPDRPLIITRGLGLTTAFFVCQGAILYAVFLVVAEQADLMLLAVAAIAWAVGFLMPGAPAGLGPREAVLLALSTGITDEPMVLIAIILFRFITTAGDVVLYAIGWALLPRSG